MKIILTKIQSLILIIIFSSFSTPSYSNSKDLQLKNDAAFYLAQVLCLRWRMTLAGKGKLPLKDVIDVAYKRNRKDNKLLTRKIFYDDMVLEKAHKIFIKAASKRRKNCVEILFK
tara:strand:- start:925 stop:1269 length:345 start_codon:yes stop_codon:yes gene_type:complete